MSVNWTAFDFKDALAAQIDLSGLMDPTPRIVTYWPSPDEIDTDLLIVGWEASDDNEQITLAAGQSKYQEAVVLGCAALVVRVNGDGAVGLARDRAEELLARVDTQVRNNKPSVGIQTISAAVTNRRSVEAPDSAGENVPTRVCVIEFDVTYRARTPST